MNIGIPFTYINTKEDIKSFYLAYLCRVFVIKGVSFFDAKITKKCFSDEMKKQWFDKKRINRVWSYWKAWNHINYITSDHLILRWKENVIWDKWFIVKLDEAILWFNAFNLFVTEIYAIRPVNQTQDFYDKFKYKRKSTAYNNEITKRSFAEKRSRGQRKIATQTWYTLKTINNRLKKSKTITTLKRYDSYNWFRVNKTNLYFTNKNTIFLRYNSEDNNNKPYCKTTVKEFNTALVSKKAIFLNNSLSLNKLYNITYDLINKSYLA